MVPQAIIFKTSKLKPPPRRLLYIFLRTLALRSLKLRSYRIQVRIRAVKSYLNAIPYSQDV